MGYTLNKAPLEGFLVVLPFDFDTGGALRLLADKAFAIGHLALSPSDQAAFPGYSAAFTGVTDWSIRNNDNNEILKIDSFSLRAVISSQSVGVGETFLLLNGDASTKTQIDLSRLPEEPFPDYNQDGHQRFTWGGELNSGSSTLLKIAESYFDLDTTRGYIRHFGAAGPCGFSGKSIFAWLVEQGNWYKSADTPQGEQAVPDPTNPLPAMTLKDLRRGSSLSFFANGPLGIAQVAGAKGAVFFANGSFAAKYSIKRAQNLAAEAHTGFEQLRSRVSAQLPVPTFEQAMTDQALYQEGGSNVLHEGIAVWDLKPRRNAGSHEPAKAAFL